MTPIQFIFGYSYSHNTPNLPQNTCELIRHFRYFRVKTLLSFCKKLDIPYNVSSNPPTPPPPKITLACIACQCFVFCHTGKLKVDGLNRLKAKNHRDNLHQSGYVFLSESVILNRQSPKFRTKFDGV